MRIIAAAILHRGIVFTGVRHGQIIEQIVKLGLMTEAERPIKDHQQGFITDTGSFRTREQSCYIAKDAGQVQKDHGTLYSEDLW